MVGGVRFGSCCLQACPFGPAFAKVWEARTEVLHVLSIRVFPRSNSWKLIGSCNYGWEFRSTFAILCQLIKLESVLLLRKPKGKESHAKVLLGKQILTQWCGYKLWPFTLHIWMDCMWSFLYYSCCRLYIIACVLLVFADDLVGRHVSIVFVRRVAPNKSHSIFLDSNGAALMDACEQCFCWCVPESLEEEEDQRAKAINCIAVFFSLLL